MGEWNHKPFQALKNHIWGLPSTARCRPILYPAHSISVDRRERRWGKKWHTVCVGHCSNMHFPSCCPSPRVKGTCRGKAGKDRRGSAGGCKPPPTTCEPGEDDPPHPGKTGQDKALLGRGGGLCRDQEFKQPGSMSSPIVKLVVPSEKMYCSNKTLCVRARVRSVAQSCPTPFDPCLREAKPESHFCVATTGMRKTKGKGQKRCPDP